jgi:hypothetical protein
MRQTPTAQLRVLTVCLMATSSTGVPMKLQIQEPSIHVVSKGPKGTNNTFFNCQIGSFIGGGRRNTVTDNYYEQCDVAQHLDNRGMTGQAGSTNCSTMCEPLSSGCNCNTGAAQWMVTKAAAAAQWEVRFPYLKTIPTDRLGQPAHNTITNNKYCKCGQFIDATQEESDAWGSVVNNNTKVQAC